jgi:hypothetical protein
MTRDMADLQSFTLILDSHVEQMHLAHHALTRNWIARARLQHQPNPHHSTPGRVNPFDKINPQHPARQITLTGKTFSITRPKGESITVTASVSTWNHVAPPAEVPNYTHYTRINRNVLGTNTKQLQVWPYFGDDIDDDGTIKDRFDVIVEDRPRKVLISQQATTYAPCFEAFIDDITCPMTYILKYLLEPTEGPDGLQARLEGYSKDRKLVRKMLSAKEKFCEDDYSRSARWVSLSSSIPELDDKTLWTAALVCHAFWTHTAFSPWQIARKYATFPENIKSEHATNYAAIACRICQIHDCPYHGTVLERPLGEDSDDDSVDTVDALDVDYPPRVNYKERVTVPLDPDGEIPDRRITIASRTRHTQPQKKSLNWWMSEENSVTWDHSKRGPFFPCNHPGLACSEAHCSCFAAKVCCEKTCACQESCTRRFTGCTCASKRGCAQDDSCECFRMNRECDPDLCTSCGAHILATPAHTKGICRNVAIQRNIPKKTLLGRSIVHGFGLHAGERIAKDEFIGEYRGEILTRDETERRGAIYEFQKLSYIFDLNRDQAVDSQRMGNKIRFINHAARSTGSNIRNVYPRIMLCNLVHRIGMYASRNISVGQELFFDYGGSYHEKLYGKDEVKGKGKAKSTLPQMRPSRKSNIPDTIFDVNDSSEDDRPRKRSRATKSKLIPSAQPPASQKDMAKSNVARKTEDRSRILKGTTASTPSIVDDSHDQPLKAAMKSALRPSFSNPKPHGETKSSGGTRSGDDYDEELEEDYDNDREEDNEEEDDDDDAHLPRRSGRSRRQSRRLRGDD